MARIEQIAEPEEADAGKRDKSSVDYGRGEPEGDHCAICKFWVAGLHDGMCRCVKGEIGAMMWCRLFKPRNMNKEMRNK